MKKIIYLLFLVTVLNGCASAVLNISRNPNQLPQKINKIALMPSGGPLADAVGIELLNFGYEIIDTTAVTGYMARYNLNEMELIMPQNINKLSTDGIDTVLLVKTVAGYDGRPESATAKLVATSTGSVIVGVTWQNGRGGAMGSPADGMMRANLSATAKQIAKGIGNAITEKR